MNPAQAIAPTPALRRRRPVRTEPVVFAVLLTLLTLGINLSGTPAPAERAEQQPASGQIASAR